MFFQAASTGAEPAGGAELSQVVIATAGALAVTAALLYLCLGHRRGTNTVLARLGAFTERMSGLPAWAALPAAIAGAALFTALFGMYWDISLHIDNGRDAGPLANPGHYFILAGLFGVFASGVIALALPRGERPGKAAVRLGPGWHAPVGGLLISSAGAFALLGFPLDDVWHRLFGQDVTLWGPTHLMLIGGAGMCLIGQAVLLAEGMQVRRDRAAAGNPLPAPAGPGSDGLITGLRRVGLMGGFLIGLSTFQAEFDFGVPQYRMAFEPILLSLAAGVGLVTARLWIGRGGALAAAAAFLAIRGGIALLVGPIIGQSTPHLPLYVVSALCVEAVALVLIRKPLTMAAVAGLAVGTVGFASEWAWSQFAMPYPWTSDLLPEALLGSVAIGVMGALVGALLALGLRGELPAPRVARLVPAAALVTFAVIAAALLQVDDGGGRVFVAVGQDRNATVRVEPASLADDPAWVTVTAWQGGGLHVDHLEPTGRPGEFRTTEPMPVDSTWKTLVRVHKGSALLGAPVRLPADAGIPAPEVPLPAATEARPLVHDQTILQRELKDDVPGWLWSAGVGTVLVIWVAFLVSLAWGVGRIARRGGTAPEGGSSSRDRRAAGATPVVA